MAIKPKRRVKQVEARGEQKALRFTIERLMYGGGFQIEMTFGRMRSKLGKPELFLAWNTKDVSNKIKELVKSHL